jgi:outer membrane protein OmpA-like peptidoglycan-associated protein
LTPEGQQVVDTIVAAIRGTKPSSIVVEGEADGASPRDAQLADQRATTVAAALKAAGVDQSKIAQHAALALPAQQDVATHVSTHKVAVQLMP